ncbi:MULTISPECIES: hypothetical protein [Paraburkholderia]|nr:MULTISPECIES: hypothetical protein [Paraburkholderia]MPW20451.1 hypothetical protein [Paraburkholderia franconis]
MFDQSSLSISGPHVMSASLRKIILQRQLADLPAHPGGLLAGVLKMHGHLGRDVVPYDDMAWTRRFDGTAAHARDDHQAAPPQSAVGCRQPHLVLAATSPLTFR